jgi:hypothetical protein
MPNSSRPAATLAQHCTTCGRLWRAFASSVIRAGQAGLSAGLGRFLAEAGMPHEAAEVRRAAYAQLSRIGAVEAAAR